MMHHDPPLRYRTRLDRIRFAILLVCLLAATSASAQTSDSLKARAWDAQRAAEEAESIEAEALESVADAEARLAEARVRAAEAREQAERAKAEQESASFEIRRRAVEPVPAPVIQQTDARELEALRAAARESAEAARRAEEQVATLRDEVQQLREEREKRYAKSGLTIAAGLAWAPEVFDTSFDFSNGDALFGAIGYRLNERFEVQLRYDGVEGFRASEAGFDVDLEGYAVTLNGRYYLLTGQLQPFIGLGLGAAHLDARFEAEETGLRIRDDETSFVVRPSAGFELYVSETIALTGEAAIFIPDGELSSLRWSTVGGGVKFNF